MAMLNNQRVTFLTCGIQDLVEHGGTPNPMV
jgi:hypothetical protein